jgi:DNA topoisomerase IB
VVRAVRALLRRSDRIERMLVCCNGSGWSDVHANDLNIRFKELVGDEYSVKDLRTWHGTVLAATALAEADPPDSERVAKRAVSAVMKQVSADLGNTPAVARSAYVDPRVVTGYRRGMTIAAAAQRAARQKDAADAACTLEKATRSLVRRVARS